MVDIVGVPRIAPKPTNKLLASLAVEDFERVRPRLTTVRLHLKHVIYKQGATIQDVYFPSRGATSLTRVMEDGGMAEVATFGNEGMLGQCVYFGDDQSLGEVIVQSADWDGLKMPVEAFLAEMKRHGVFYDRVIRYAQALTSHVMHTGVCNGLHSVEQRCCRWLLMSRDRAGTNDLKVTHEFLAVMLGVRRPTITLVLGELQTAGVVDNHRGIIHIIDGPRLELASCECYATLKRDFARLLPEIGGSVV
jgi:CRP-like cAMP-binding protein